MSLGLDLRGGVYVLLEVDMDTAIANRMQGYEQDFDSRLREARIRHRVDLNNGIITIRLTSPEDLEEARRALEVEVEEEVRALQADLERDAPEVEEVIVRPTKADIQVSDLKLALDPTTMLLMKER